MKKIFFFIITAVFFISAAGCSSSTGQQKSVPEEIKRLADTYITERTGEELFESSFRYDSAKSSADSVYYNLVYRFSIPGKEYIDEEIKIIIDSSGTVINKPVQGIPECIKDPSQCEFNVSEREAVGIAEDNGLEKGKKGLLAEFVWQPEYSRYVWKVNSVTSESEGTHGYRGSGEVIIINPASGMVLDKSEWFVR
jgi:hypothetical protein